jgi:hypothetical protein
MTIGVVALLAGLFLVPAVLLAWGHRIRRLPPRSRRAFWGAIIGHVIAGTLALTSGMIPIEEWSSDETVRGFLGLWALLIFPVIGAGIAALTEPGKQERGTLR